jgi:hypothetical protein
LKSFLNDPKSGSHKVQDLDCVMDEENILLKTAPGVALFTQALFRQDIAWEGDSFLCEQAEVQLPDTLTVESFMLLTPPGWHACDSFSVQTPLGQVMLSSVLQLGWMISGSHSCPPEVSAVNNSI